jgi:hypothetical protein
MTKFHLDPKLPLLIWLLLLNKSQNHMRWLFSSEAKSFKPANAFSLHLEVKGNLVARISIRYG